MPVVSVLNSPEIFKMTWFATVYPNTAGMVPRTGRMRTRKSGNTPRSPTDPFWNSSSASGSSAALPSPIFSVEYTTGMPLVTPSSFNLLRVALDRPSSKLAPISPTITLVGSLLMPAPMAEMTGSPSS